jgi:thiosulfate/3-mercaptopyruvate sulfurtransferase
VGDTKRIVIYGDLNGLAAARAFFTLDYLGHGERVALLDGGLEKWKTEKREVSTTSAMLAPDEFTPRVNPRAVIALDAVRDVSWSAAKQRPAPVALIDARPGEEYAGTKPGEGISRPGHLPGAVNVFWQNHFVSRESLALKPENELRKLYEAAGLAANRPVAVYCRTGAQASHSYFILRYLGYQAMMYDGSFFEWSRQPDTPVAGGK